VEEIDQIDQNEFYIPVIARENSWDEQDEILSKP
jgi:hypothetical protein